jgi:tripartite ATP-independent transporter DctM subunit
MRSRDHPGPANRQGLAHEPLGDLRFFRPAIDTVLKGILVVAVLGELGIVVSNVLNRLCFNRAFPWTDEAAELALATVAFFGGVLAYRRGEHAFLHSILDVLPLRCQRACYVLIEYLVLGISIATGLSSVLLLVYQWQVLTPILQVRVGWFLVPLVMGMTVLALTAAERLAAQHRRTVIIVGAVFLPLVLALVATQDLWRPWVAGEAPTISLGLFFGAVLLGVPVAFALLLGALVYFSTIGTVPMLTIAHTMVGGISNFVLLALPFFVFVALIMNQGGLSRRLVHLAQAFVGHFRGGLFQVMVVSMYIVSGLSGSKMADVVVVGSVMRDMLRRERYNMEQATAVLAAATVMGETVPPSIPMLVLGSVTTLSIGTLFVAGLLPAAVIGVCLMLLIYLQFRRSDRVRPPRASLAQLIKAVLNGVLPLLMPVILFGGILLGVATPTEVSAFAVVYGLVLAGCIYRELGLRALLKSVIDCAAGAGMVLFILAAASSFSRALTIAHLPQQLVGLLSGVQHSPWLFVLASILLLIVTGAILEGLPALVILAPILLPIAAQIGLSPLHYGIVLIIAMGFGTFLPPVGIGFYVACAVLETSLEPSARAMIPYIIVLCIGLVLVGLVPWFTLALPTYFHFSG